MKTQRSLASRVLWSAVLVFGFSLSVSGAGFIKFDGVDGESQASGHVGESDVLSWSWGVSQPDGAETGESRRRGTAIIGDLVFTKAMDKASVKLLESVTQGKVFPKVTLALDTPGSDPLTYFVVEMTNVLVTSFSIEGSEGDDRPIEKVALNFEEVKATYTIYDSNGTKAGIVEMTWKAEEG